MKSLWTMVFVYLFFVSSDAFSQCAGTTAGCHLACGVTFGFGNPTYCALFDNNGKLYGKLKYIPPCVKPGCFPITQTLYKNPDGTVRSLMIQGNNSNTPTFHETSISVNSQLQFLSNKNVPALAALKPIGFPFLKAIDTTDPNTARIIFLQRRSSATATNFNDQSALFAALKSVNFDKSFGKFKGAFSEIFKVIDEEEFEILGGNYQVDGSSDIAILLIRNRRTGQLLLLERRGIFVKGSPQTVHELTGPDARAFRLAAAVAGGSSSLSLSPKNQSSAASTAFIVERMVLQAGGAFKSQVLLRTFNLNTGQISPPKTITPLAATTQPAAEGLASVAIDAQKRFVLYAGSSGNCSSIKFQKINPNTGSKQGGAKTIVSCSDLDTSITGLYGIDLLNLQ